MARVPLPFWQKYAQLQLICNLIHVLLESLEVGKDQGYVMTNDPGVMTIMKRFQQECSY